MLASRDQQRAILGLVRRKEVWSLTWRARLILLLLGLTVAVGVLLGIHPFLALDSQVKSRVLVVEGWVPEYALTNFISLHPEYERIYTTGGPTLTDRYSTDVSDTFASVCYHRLLKTGVPRSTLVMVPSWISKRDRTYAAAVSLRQWCETNRVELKAFNLVTLGPHARRSRLLYEKAFPHAQIGIIPLTNEEYEADHWWRYSEGVKETLSEAMAYVYSRFLFSPE